jgi:hypothetical protein
MPLTARVACHGVYHIMDQRGCLGHAYPSRKPEDMNIIDFFRRDRDRIYGAYFWPHVWHMGIEEILISPCQITGHSCNRTEAEKVADAMIKAL